MSKPKWTKGPWIVGDEDYYRMPTSIWATGNVFIGCTDGMTGPVDVSRGEQEANARLIATAPQLYEALDDALTYIVEILTGPIMQKAGIRWPEGGPQGPVIQRIRAVLAEARGDKE